GHAVDHAQQLDDSRHAVEVPDHLLEAAQAVEGGQLRRLPCRLDIDVPSNLSQVDVVPIFATRPMTGEKHQVAGPDSTDVVEHRRSWIGDLVAELGEPLLDF